MSARMRIVILQAALVALCAAGCLSVSVSAKDFVKPAAQAAKTYPAHDEHPLEKVTIAADPYDSGEKAKIFSINFLQHGLLPVFFIVTNDGDQPVSIASMEIMLTTQNGSKLTPTSSEDIYRRLSNPQGGTRPSPLPLPQKAKGGVSRKAMDEIESSQFAAKAVEPHTTQSGFLFFDVGGISSPLRGATIDVTHIADAKGNELLYFEIPVDKYLNAPVNP